METYHYYLVLPLEPTPTCFTKQRGTSRTQEFKCIFVFWSTKCNVWNLEACNIPLERSLKYLKIHFQWYITHPKILKIKIPKQKEKSVVV
jgi:hypothetical protein